MSRHAALLRDPGHFLALGCGSGLVPRAPGTAGTVVGVGLFWLVADLDKPQYLVLVCVLFGIGIPLCQRTAAAMGAHDHPAIVWDEIVGYLLTMAFVAPGFAACIVGFIAFRLFDIFKPWPIALLDRHVPGGMGIMLDDILAAIYAGLVLAVIEYLSYI
jgi:phosphatidylglycerophosphatase A